MLGFDSFQASMFAACCLPEPLSFRVSRVRCMCVCACACADANQPAVSGCFLFHLPFKSGRRYQSTYLRYNKCSMIKNLLCAIAVVAFITNGAAAFAPVSLAPHQLSVRTAAWRLGGTKDGEDDPSTSSNNATQNEGSSLFDQINDFLDTPILDANNRSDQGAIAETLKRFVRREPQLASITFSAVVVAFMFLLVRLYNFVSYGI